MKQAATAMLLVFGVALGAVGMQAVTPCDAAAQEPSRAEVAAARRLFRQGMAAGREENWAEARDAFAQAYAIAPRPRMLLNLGSAQMQTGQLLEATETYQTFLRTATGSRDAQYREGVQEELAGLEERTPRINIEVQGLGGNDEVRVDDGAISRAVLGVELPLNPGAHSVAVFRGGTEVAREDLDLAEGQRRAVALNAGATLPAPSLPNQDVENGDDLLAPDDDGDSGGILTSPWFWGGVGAAVVTGVIIAVVVASSGGSADRQSGNFGDGRLLIE